MAEARNILCAVLAGVLLSMIPSQAFSREARFAAHQAGPVSGSALPSGTTTYRRLPDYGNEMKALAANNPGIVKAIALPFQTYEGRTVEGLEITTDPNARDGKPVFLQLGLSHARDWPSGELVMEWAHELVNGYNAGDPRVQRLMGSARTIVIPVVNPDGFTLSREAGEANGAGGGRGGSEAVNIATHPYEYRRKNCRLADDSAAGNCTQPSTGLDEPGVDLSRNYGAFWGGPGASTNPLDQTYRGPGPFSEPEGRNVRDLVSRRPVTTLISNHSFGNRVLRPPGMQRLGETSDEALYKALGDAMAAANGYLSLRTNEVHSATGTPEDWAYYSTGALGFTLEIGCADLDAGAGVCDAGNFHPPYAGVVSSYESNREAYFTALEHTADSSKHSVIEGQAPAGSVLRLRKTFQTPTSPLADGNPILFQDTLETTMQVPSSGGFEWHLNPSTRPLVAQARGRAATGDPSAEQTFTGASSGPPVDGAAACGDTATETATCFNDHPFTVPSGAGVDNASARVRITWESHTSDWDLKVFRDSNGDASSAGETEVVGRSSQRFTELEEADIAEPELQPGQNYVARVVNFAATDPYEGVIIFAGPEPFQPARSESWTLSCESPEGTVRAQQEITIARGQRQRPDLGACFSPAPAADPLPDPPPRVLGLTLRPRSFRTLPRGPSIRAAASRGTRLTYRLSEPATARFRVERSRPGRRVGRRCVAPNSRSRSRRRCTRYTTLRGAFSHRGKAGVNRLRFSGRLRGRRLAPGRYRLVVVATDAAGQRSAVRRAAFRIVRR